MDVYGGNGEMKLLRRIVKAIKWLAISFAAVIFIAITLILLFPSKAFNGCIAVLRKLSDALVEIEGS